MNISIESKKLDFIGKQSPLEENNYDVSRVYYDKEIKEINIVIDEYAEISINGVEMIPLELVRKIVIDPVSWWADTDRSGRKSEDFSIMLALRSDGDENGRECGIDGMLRDIQYINMQNGGSRDCYRHLSIKDIFKLFINSYGEEPAPCYGASLKGKMMEVFDEAVKECEEANGKV